MAHRTYVKADSRFDETGSMVPTALIWGNRILPIENILDFRPAKSIIGRDCSLPG